MVFKGPRGELLIDGRFLKPCNARLARCKLRQQTTTELKGDIEVNETSIISKGYSDSSSDSGYDESSNQGVIFNGYNSSSSSNTNNNNNISKKDNNNKKDCLIEVENDARKTEIQTEIN